MTIKIDFTGLEGIMATLNRILAALGGDGISTALPSPQVTTATPIAAQIPTTASVIPPTVPVQTQVQPTIATPLSQQQPAQQTMPAYSAPLGGSLPTTAMPQEYTQDQIAVAMSGLVDLGKQPLVMQVLGQLGAGSLMAVPKEQYPVLATLLRGLGAVI